MTEKVDLGGFAFSLENDAYEKCRSYIESIEAFYKDCPDVKEIVEAIESRIAEILLEMHKDGSVVTLKSVEKVIEILGTTEQIEENDVTSQSSDRITGSKGQKDGRFRYNEKRRFYRDPSNKILGGVCSGIATYYNIDVSAVRILTVLVFLAFGFVHFPYINIQLTNITRMFNRDLWSMNLLVPLAYVIMWIVVPPANTARQRWEMRGEDGSFSDVGRTMRDGTYSYNAPESNRAGYVLLRLIMLFIGAVLFLVGYAGIMAGACTMLGLKLFDLTDFINPEVVMGVRHFLPLYISAACTYFIPFIAMIYGGIMLMFDLKSPKWHPGLVLFLLWAVALTATVVLGMGALTDSAPAGSLACMQV